MNWTTIVAIVSITILASIAMLCGFDGAFLATALAAISGLGGYQIHQNKTSSKGG